MTVTKRTGATNGSSSSSSSSSSSPSSLLSAAASKKNGNKNNSTTHGDFFKIGDDNNNSNYDNDKKIRNSFSASSSENGSSSSSSTSSSSMMTTRLLRLFLLTIPLYATFVVWLAVHGLLMVYSGPLSKLLTSFEISELQDDSTGLYLARDPEITYYNRQCHLDDISTRDANDLLIESHHSREQRKDIMMNHGAVVMKNILSHNTSSQLREYLEQRHDTFMANGMTLPWNELFWNDNGERLSLGIGPEDDPIIAQALHEVGHNEQLEETLTAILGPNPALVEVSTLTTMHGATPQGIHTDSDFFGSSVMYARTFLHSYTMFVALQHTTAKMGATTICPGTHMCANEDLEEVCMAPTPSQGRNSFEASSNGETGLETGALLQGDAMMFNQNVWHRGPLNKDPDRPYNRVMFILTFVSQRDFDKGDVRQQGWGTYYYMRHSMWGQAFDDLKNVLIGGMSLPVRFLKAYGLYSTPSSGNGHGMPWLEHWARQMANEMDFFTVGELETFIEFLQKSPVPKRILGNPETDDWNDYLFEMIDNAVEWIDDIYLWVFFVYVVVHLVAYSLSSSGGRATKASKTAPPRWKRTASFLLPLIIGHGLLAGMAFMSFSLMMTYTPLFRRIGGGYVSRKPFPVLYDAAAQARLSGHITTVPERMDVLIGSRFDAPYLASMNEMLDYHPGNKDWNRQLQETAPFPLKNVASQVLVEQVTSTTKQLRGVTRRFLEQDHATGIWSVMSTAEAEKETLRALKMAGKPLVANLVSYWKEVLADSRFGLLRDTTMAKTWIPKTAGAWLDTVFFAEEKKAKTNVLDMTKKSTPILTVMKGGTSLEPPPTKPLSFREHLQEMTRNTIILKHGDIVLVKGTLEEEVHLAKILEITSPTDMVIRYVDSYNTRTVSINDIQPYVPIEQSDRVRIPPAAEEAEDGWDLGQVLMMYATGVVDVMIAGTDIVESLHVGEIYLEAEGQIGDFRLDWS